MCAKRMPVERIEVIKVKKTKVTVKGVFVTSFRQSA